MIVDEVIARLREYGYLDDAKFAQNYASLRVRERPIGRRRLERDLSLKKVDKQTVSTALDEVFEATPEEDLIERAIAKRVRLRGKPKSREDAKKLFDLAFDCIRLGGKLALRQVGCGVLFILTTGNKAPVPVGAQVEIGI